MLYGKVFLFKLAMILLIAGALNWFFVAVAKMNVLESMLGETVSRVLYVLVGISALVVMFNRDTYLPFLGPSLTPCAALQNREPPGATKEVKVIVPANSKVIYWAAEPASESLKGIQSAMEAYQKFDNAGVTTANADGIAILKVREPQSYSVPILGKLDSHVHYRVCGESGFMGRVQTAFINHAGPEGFQYENKEMADQFATL
jgi:uncharacterized membrane protein YuzA (DUF378 family)